MRVPGSLNHLAEKLTIPPPPQNPWKMPHFRHTMLFDRPAQHKEVKDVVLFPAWAWDA